MTIILILTAVSLGIFAFQTAAAFLFGREQAGTSDSGRDWPMVSILKPMKSLDDEFRANLHSFMVLDYPRYEIVFGIDEPDDACAREARGLQARYPAVPQKVVVTGSEKRQNPKIATLVPMAEHAAGGLLWISDANTRVAPGVLKSLVREHLVS